MTELRDAQIPEEPDADEPAERLTPAELRELFLFSSLDEQKLDWLAEQGRIQFTPAGEDICVQGEPATCFYVLLQGTVTLSRLVRGDQVEMNRTDQKGVYAGATQAYLGERVDQTYTASMKAITDTRLFVLPASAFATMMREWFPMAMHLLEGLMIGMQNSQRIIGERERLLALGSLSAGLTHELNNPAAAAVRATAALRERVAGMRHKLAMIADGKLSPAQLHELVGLQEAAVERVAKAPKLSAMQASDAEDELSDWLDDRGVAAGWELAPVLVSGGIDAEWLCGVADTVTEGNLESALRWIAYSVDTESLMAEIEDAVDRISTLVAAAKQYSQMDRAPFQVVDVHELLESTLVMLGRKLSTIRVVTDFDRDLPRIPAYAAELNQVWTNIIDNAISAMDGHGTLTVRTYRQDAHLVVEIGDTGPGIPADIRHRIFEPFFTTKPVGEGTGLGLDISYRIVVNKHHGDIRVESEPGDTRFSVLLPIEESSN